MRVVVVSEDYPPETARGGVGTQARWKAVGLAQRGHRVRVLSVSPDGTRTETTVAGVDVTRISGPDTRLTIHGEASRWLLWSVQIAEALEQLRRAEPFDLVDFPEFGGQGYAYSINRPADDPALIATQLHGPLAMLAATLGWPEPDSDLLAVGGHMEAICVQRSDVLYSSSDCSADWCAQAYGVARTEIPTLHSGVDTTVFAPAPVAAQDPVVTFVGRLDESKGVITLAVAAQQLRQSFPGLRLRMIGHGDERMRQRLRAAASAGDGSDWLELVPFLSRDGVADALRGSQVFAAPSRYEGGPGLVYLEAMACGLPVVACGGSGADEVLRSEVNGLLVPPGDVGALVKALDRLLSDPDLRARLGRAGRQQVIDEADSDACLSRLEAYLEQAHRSRQ